MDTKNLTSKACSDIDNPARVFSCKEMVDNLRRTREPGNRNTSQEPDTGNGDQKIH